jgi:hypothetical protein
MPPLPDARLQVCCDSAAALGARFYPNQSRCAAAYHGHTVHRGTEPRPTLVLVVCMIMCRLRCLLPALWRCATERACRCAHA